MKIKEPEPNNARGQSIDNELGSIMSQNPGEGSRQNKLLETYMRIVKTGAPDEIEQFSKIERQKLVELLCTNQDLLNFMFDRMFVHVNEQQDNSSKGGMNKSNQFVLQQDHDQDSFEHISPLAFGMSEINGSNFHSEAVRSRPIVKQVSNGYGQKSTDTVALGSKGQISPQDTSQVQIEQSPQNQKDKENLIKNLNQLSSLQQYE